MNRARALVKTVRQKAAPAVCFRNGGRLFCREEIAEIAKQVMKTAFKTATESG
jgi:hypothetical protein